MRKVSTRCAARGASVTPGAAPAPASAAGPAPAPAPATRAQAPAPERELLFGFNDNSVAAQMTTPAQDADLNARVGANVVRLTFDWRFAEPQKDDYRFGLYDDIYRESLARGVRPLFIVLFAPSWALDPSTPCNQWAADCRLPPSRANDPELAQVAALLADRYPQAAGIEVWNEPNQNHFWKSGPDPARYAEMLRAVYPAVKAVDPAMPVAGASLSDNPDGRFGIPPREYLRALYQAGVKGNMDAISIHPYSHVPGLLDKTFADVRATRQAYGDSETPLWVTETGVTTSGQNSDWPDIWLSTPAEQATKLVALYRKLSAMPDVEALMIHTLVEPRGDVLTNPYLGFGVLDPELEPKPAYCALALERGRPDPCL